VLYLIGLIAIFHGNIAKVEGVGEVEEVGLVQICQMYLFGKNWQGKQQQTSK
jgi:hypothetical protein